MRDSAWIAWPIAALLGPLAEFRRHPVASVLAIVFVALLTIATQIGGAVLWVFWPLLRQLRTRLQERLGRLSNVVSFVVFKTHPP